MCTCDEAALDELVRVLAHDLAVLARAGLRLVGVHHQERRTPVRLQGVTSSHPQKKHACKQPVLGCMYDQGVTWQLCD
jgi:hypothetical protein